MKFCENLCAVNKELLGFSKMRRWMLFKSWKGVSNEENGNENYDKIIKLRFLYCHK